MNPSRLHSDTGMSLIEVLAAVVVLSLFFTVMISLLGQSFTVSKQDQEKQEATILAQNALVQIAREGAQNFFSNGKSITEPVQTIDGISFTVQMTKEDSLPTWAQSGIYTEVTVSWPTLHDGQKVVGSVALDQLFT